MFEDSDLRQVEQWLEGGHGWNDIRAKALMGTLQPDFRKHFEGVLLAALNRCTFMGSVDAAEVRSALKESLR